MDRKIDRLTGTWERGGGQRGGEGGGGGCGGVRLHRTNDTDYYIWFIFWPDRDSTSKVVSQNKRKAEQKNKLNKRYGIDSSIMDQ